MSSKDIVRDYYFIYEGTSDFVCDFLYERLVAVYDWHVWNLGTAPITVTLDGSHDITIPIGSDRGFDSVRVRIIRVAADGQQYSLAVAGVKVSA